MVQDNSSTNNGIDTLKHYLGMGPVWVKFTKADGSVRNMCCTQDNTLIAEILRDLGRADQLTESGRKPNDDILVVWDLEKENWRSFRKDSVLGFDVNLS